MEIKNDVANIKTVRSDDGSYNYLFNKDTGFFMRWGRTYEEDPTFSPLGPEILDIEISTICHQGCSFCYKSNTGQGKNMSFSQFVSIFHKFPTNLTQIAFGIGSIDSNPDLWNIMDYCRTNDYTKVVPNITINGARMIPEYYDKLVDTCGAVAVSNYGPDQCYTAVQELANRGLKQVNIHQLLCEETYEQCLQLMVDYKRDPRLQGLNAIVFLLMKPKGQRNYFHQLRDMKRYKALINKALTEHIPIGFDSCAAPSFMKAVDDRPDAAQLKECCEPCESNCFSSYVNTEGRYFHCSFTEDQPGWDGIDMYQVDNFMKDVWNNPEVLKFRGKLEDSEQRCGCRTCPIFDLEIS